MEFKINFGAVAVCVLLSFTLGFIWYAAILTKPWIAEMGYDPNMRPDTRQMMKGMVVPSSEIFFSFGCLPSTWPDGGIFLIQNI